MAIVGEMVGDLGLVTIALNSFTKQWANFVKGIAARENLPNWERLWDDFIQEEIQEESLYGGQQEGDDEKNVALAS